MKVVEEDLQHLKRELAATQPSMVMQVAEGVFLEEEEAEEEEMK